MNVIAPVERVSVSGFIATIIIQPISTYNETEIFLFHRNGENLKIKPANTNPQTVPKIVQPQMPFSPTNTTGV